MMHGSTGHTGCCTGNHCTGMCTSCITSANSTTDSTTRSHCSSLVQMSPSVLVPLGAIDLQSALLTYVLRCVLMEFAVLYKTDECGW